VLAYPEAVKWVSIFLVSFILIQPIMCR